MYYSITLNASTSIKNAVETTFKHIDFIPFTFVRNPYSRVVSMWNRYREENSTNITFDSFVNLLVSEKTLKHYHRNQIDVLSDADIQYMGYVEQIKVDMHRLILLCDPGQLTCFDNLSDLKIPRLNKSKYLDVSKYPYTGKYWQKYYTSESKNTVEQLFHDDFDQLGYDFSGITDKLTTVSRTLHHFPRSESRIKTALHRLKIRSEENVEQLDSYKEFTAIDTKQSNEWYTKCDLNDGILNQRSRLSDYMSSRRELHHHYVSGQTIEYHNRYTSVSLDAVYYITLDGSTDTQQTQISRLKNIYGDRLVVFSAIDSRDDKRNVYETYGLNLNPSTDEYVWNFSTSYGAVGCYLSHWLIYKDIITKKHDHVLILEEDVSVDDLETYMSTDKILIPRNVDYIQFNNRVFNRGSAMASLPDRMVDGTECYYISRSGANKLLDATSNYPWEHSTHRRRYNQWLSDMLNDGSASVRLFDPWFIKKQNVDSLKQPNSIRAPIDRFIGMLCDPGIPIVKRLSWFELPLISLESSLADDSDVINDKPHWEMSIENLKNFENVCDTYKWWE